ncbi:EF-hand domain-containing protein [Edaphovirga cremea]|uniref:EF-hand domain-containing protein n=1 Tax=Edaphovirga cremea TaxID=2267246 RepID=UPI000DEFCEB0|nr:EF-hand domain-containing protein [Edaphovirga cremea]
MSQLTAEQLELIKQELEAYDSEGDGDGTVTFEEFTAAFAQYVDDDELQRIKDRVDKNNDGKISYQEYLDSKS